MCEHDDQPYCQDCGHNLHPQAEKALGEPGPRKWQMVWADADGNWICPRTGDEHVPQSLS